MLATAGPDASLATSSSRTDLAAAPLASTFQPRPEFTLIALPDTQFYSQSYPETFTAQTQWIVDHKHDKNIVFVSHLGDIVQEGDETWEWARASTSMSRLEGSTAIPYGLCVGNHDSDPRGDPGGTANYNTYFPVSRFAGRPWYGGHYANDNDNSYQLFSAAGMDFVIIHLQYDENGDEGVLAWADSVLKAHASRRAIVSSHDILSKTEPDDFSDHGQLVYDRLKGNPNLFLMLCGHCSSLSEGRRSDVFNGHTVWTLLSDYQRRDNGGDGWLRVMRFRPDYNDIQVTTYSVTLDLFETDDSSQFVLPYDMDGIRTVVCDFNRDGDVDMEDFGVLQGCLTDPYEPVAASCIPADFNHGDHVNQNDLTIFVGCLTGSGLPVDLSCTGA